jgi:hypothetical protein
MKEGLQTEKVVDRKFGVMWNLKFYLYKHKQAIEKLQEEVKPLRAKVARLWFDRVMKKKIWDPLTGHREKTQEECETELKEISLVQDPLEDELKMKLADLKCIQKSIDRRTEADKITRKYFADLSCWTGYL